MFYSFEDCLDFIVGAFTLVFLFITCPLWGIPYVVYNRIKNSRREKE